MHGEPTADRIRDREHARDAQRIHADHTTVWCSRKANGISHRSLDKGATTGCSVQRGTG